MSPEPKAWLCQYDGFGVHKRSQHHPGDEPLFTRAAILAPILALHVPRIDPASGIERCSECHGFWPCATARAAGVESTE